jgi:hypothetical protein
MELWKIGKKQELIEKEPLHSNPLEVDYPLARQQLLVLVEQRKRLQPWMSP